MTGTWASGWATGDIVTAAEFKKYDLNGDGFITPKECLAAQEALKKSGSSSGSGSGSSSSAFR